MKVDTVTKVMAIVANDKVEKIRGMADRGAATGQTEKSDEVSISGLVGTLRQSLASDATPGDRPEKIARIKAEIDAGTYSVSGQAVAAKMLRLDRLTK